MKKYKDFIPRADAELIVYANTYKHNLRKLVAEAIPYLPLQEVEHHEAEVQEMIETIQQVESKKAELAALIAHKNALVQNTTGNIRRMAMLAKKGNARNTATVLAGGLKCNPVHINVKDLSPQLHITTHSNFISIAFPKNHSLPIALYCRKPGDANWELVSYAATSPYIDNRPPAIPGQPEKREYQAYYTNFKDCISQMSSIVTVVYSPVHIVEENNT